MIFYKDIYLNTIRPLYRYNSLMKLMKYETIQYTIWVVYQVNHFFLKVHLFCLVHFISKRKKLF